MKNFIRLVLIMLVAVFSCKAHETANNYTIQAISESTFNKLKATTNNTLIDTMEPIKKQHSRLILPLDNSRVSIFEDTLGDLSSDMVKYDYIGKLKAFNSYIIRVTYLMGENTWLIDKYDGRIIKLLRFIYPSQKGLTIVSCDLPDNDEFNEIRVLKKYAGDYEILCDIHPKDWYPDDICWVSKNKFLVKAINMDQSISTNRYYKIKLK